MFMACHCALHGRPAAAAGRLCVALPCRWAARGSVAVLLKREAEIVQPSVVTKAFENRLQRFDPLRGRLEALRHIGKL